LKHEAHEEHEGKAKDFLSSRFTLVFFVFQALPCRYRTTMQGAEY
jgi:hypothetical protein